MTQNETIIFKDASGMVMQVLSCGNELVGSQDLRLINKYF